MKYLSTLRVIYLLLLVLLVAQGTWWVIFLGREGQNYENYRLERLEVDRRVADLLLSSEVMDRESAADFVAQYFPDLLLRESEAGLKTMVAPAVRESVHTEAGRRERMFLYEGVFFLGLLLAGSTVLVFAYRAERRFRKSRELFLAGVTHEFRTPLASLQLYTETLERQGLDEDDRSRIHKKMIQDVQRLESLVDQLLATSRDSELDPRSFEPLDLAAETKNVLEEMSVLFDREGAQLETNLPDARHILGERQAFAVALRNLLHNALKFSPPPARISITLDGVDGWHRLMVRDWGPGIRRSYQKKIFDDFYRIEEEGETSHRPTRGAGLGLYLARRNVEALGGRLLVESREGEGATFTMMLPPNPRRSP